MVSRETLLAEGLSFHGFSSGGSVERLSRYAQLLETEAIPRGFMGNREVERIAERHILECVGLAACITDRGLVVDVGSGAGLPGVILSCLRADPVVLVEPQARRAAFLRRVVGELDLDATVVQERAESAGRGDLRDVATVATARALADPLVTLELTLPFVGVEGAAALLVGGNEARRAPEGRIADPGSAGWAGGGPTSEAPDPSRLAAVALELGGGAPERRRFDVPGAGDARWVLMVPKLGRTPDRYPRSASAIRRRPLGRV